MEWEKRERSSKAAPLPWTAAGGGSPESFPSPGGGGGGGGRGRRGWLALALICFSPLLLPLICLSLPLLCIAAFCLRFQRRRKSSAGHREDGGGGFPVRCKEGEKAISERLLHRYLEDQLGLVGTVWDYDNGDG